MRPAVFIAMLFFILAVVATAIMAGFGWAILNADGSESITHAVLLGAAGTVLFLFTLAGAWASLHLRLARPIETITREIETLAHAKKVRQIKIADGHLTGGLSDAVQHLIARFISARTKRQAAINTAVESAETYKRRLETILLDLSEGVIVCNLDNRVLLYNQAAMRILKRPEVLGLGRRLFALFEREPILETLEELTAKQRGDKTRKLRTRRQITCERLDGAVNIDAQLALICSDEVETEGYVLTFTPAADMGDEAGDALPPRPEFYDFDLFKRQPDRKLTDIPINELRCVVFDTETTGLEPSNGDELISIGAVRVVNSRILRSETFEQLINPGRKIPKSSTRFHGLTDKDVKGKPDAKTALPRFHRFCGRAVLVAHNAAFDMKFLELKEKASGVSFQNPVLDVLLLSAYLHDHVSDHSMNATAERLGVEISGRHTALGDAETTAAIYLAMLGPLATRGVLTLGDALKVSRAQVKIQKEQAKF
ncbi:MAG: exonuclease domain-containing protein [Alphaproteobacteria bacterium]